MFVGRRLPLPTVVALSAVTLPPTVLPTTAATLVTHGNGVLTLPLLVMSDETDEADNAAAKNRTC